MPKPYRESARSAVRDRSLALLQAGRRPVILDMLHEWRSSLPRTPVDMAEWRKSRDYRSRPYCIVGDASVYDVEEKMRYVDEPFWPVPEAELARAYVQWLFEIDRPTETDSMEQARVPYTKEAAALATQPPPLWYPGTEILGDLAYVDITSCYFNIYRHATYDVAYSRNKYLGLGRMVFRADDELAGRAILRNAVVGNARSLSRRVSRYGRHSTEKSRGHLFAPGLWCLVNDTTTAIAHQAISRFGACYVHTDGFIVPADRAEGVLEWLEDAWHLPAEVKAQGEGRVRALGAWEIGGVASASHAERGRYVRHLFPMTKEEQAWVRRKRIELTTREPRDLLIEMTAIRGE